MTRWEPDARGRLERAAMELYSERGFDQTTVVEIATRAGLTERTFFRHFADKREVLFGGAGALEELLVEAVDGAPASATPIEAVAAGIEVLGTVFRQGREYSRQRQRVIMANPDLQERELIKLAALTSAISAALRRRGASATAADLAAQVGIAVFSVAFERWIAEDEQADFAELVRESFNELKTVISEAQPEHPHAVRDRSGVT